MFRYETHCHTAATSKCGKMSAEEVVDLYVKNGYSGVIITDHFINGNSYAKYTEGATYEEKIEMFMKGYREVKAAAGDRLTVMFGFEYGYRGTDILVYGWDEEMLLSHPEMMDLSPKEFIDFANENGAFTVQAHPYRQAGYIDHVRLFTNTQGVEIINASMNEMTNDLAKFYATSFGKYMTSGSDAHTYTKNPLGGMEFPMEIHSIEEYIAAVKAGLGTPILIENVVAPKE